MKRNARKTTKWRARASTRGASGNWLRRVPQHLPPRLWVVLAALAAILWLAWLSARASASMTDCLEATCRITAPDGSRGTGCVFEINHGLVYILTVAHVVGQQPSVECEFWRAGHQSQPLPGRVLGRTAETQGDAAIVAVEAGRFGGLLPAVVPVATPSYALRAGDAITSAGCPNGAWSTGWKGHVLRLEGGDLHFVPPPAQGRSGSAIFDAEGRQIIGLLRARTIDNQEGIACTVQSLYRQLGFPTQCPGGCMPAPGAEDDVNGRLFGRLFQRTQPTPAAPWPTAPQSTDLSPLAARLDRLADTVAGLRAPASAAGAPGVDPTMAQALQQMGGTLDQHGRAIEQLRAEGPKAIEAAVKPLHDRVSQIDETIKPFASIKARLDADIEAGGLKGKIAQRIEDNLADPTAWIKHALIAVGVVVALAVAGLAIHAIHVHAGKTAGPSLLERELDKLKTGLSAGAVANPALAPLAAGATGVDALVHAIHNRIDNLQSQVSQVALNTPAPTQAAAPQTPKA